jgi:hypothetical protein
MRLNDVSTQDAETGESLLELTQDELSRSRVGSSPGLWSRLKG